jgi:hypothetical protein
MGTRSPRPHQCLNITDGALNVSSSLQDRAQKVVSWKKMFYWASSHVVAHAMCANLPKHVIGDGLGLLWFKMRKKYYPLSLSL